MRVLSNTLVPATPVRGQRRSGLTALAMALALAWGSSLFAAAATPAVAPLKLTIDGDHSAVTFSVRHLFTRVQGRFSRFNGSVIWDEQAIENSSTTVTIEAASVDTNTAKRDEDLRSARFFDAAKYPRLEFHSRSVRRAGEKKFQIEGTLTMHGVSRNVVLDAEFLGSGSDPWGNRLYGFHATARVNRKDFGMAWNEAIETGGVLVGDDIDIAIDIEATPAS
jgi:polyisoprenoid-binding protein YceI